MALIKQNIKLESVQFSFDDAGNVAAMHLNRTYDVGDDATLDSEGSPRSQGTLRDAPDVWGQLTATQQNLLNQVAKRLNQLAAAI